MATERLSSVVAAEEFDLELPSGHFHAKRFGSTAAPLVLCIPGLSANLISFDFLGERLGSEALHVVAVDLRGRGKSEVTAPGTYGWVNHAKDVFAIADALGAERFSIIGQSMGGAVAMVGAYLNGSRIERIALLDICSAPDASASAAIGASINRLGASYPSVDAYLDLLRALGTIEPWSEYWERYFRYELREVDGGVTSRTDRQAVFEDAAFGAGALAFGDSAGVYELWTHLTMPVLLLRASREILPGFGYIVPERERDRFLRDVPTSTVVEIDANHYTINMDEAAQAAIAKFLGDRG